MSKSESKPFDPSSYPTVRLFSHILQKGYQAGGIVSLFGVLPGLYIYQRRICVPLITATSAYTTLGLIGASGALGAFKYMDMDKEGLEDRVYRIHYNESQNRCDQFSQAGSLVGFLAAFVLLKQSSPLNALGCTALGGAMGVVAHVISYPLFKSEK